MAIDPNKLKSIRADAEAWLDTRFGNLDLASFPDFANPPAEESFLDSTFGHLDTSASDNAAALKQFLRNPDQEAIKRAVHETGDTELAERLVDERERIEAEAFVAAFPEYYAVDSNQEALRRYLDRHGLEFTRGNLATAYRELMRRGRIEAAPGTPRPVSDQDLRGIAAQAANGDPLGAMHTYLQFRLPQDVVDRISEADNYDGAMTLLADPLHARVLEEGVWFVFENSRVDFAPTPARRKFMKSYCGERFLTLELLSAAWKTCQEAEKSGSLSASFAPGINLETAHESNDDFNGLSDDELTQLTRKTLAEARQKLGRRRGIIV